MDRERDKQRLESSLKENRTLLEEIHHRVKNNLAVVAGLLQLQWLQEEDPKLITTLKKSANRIEAIAGIHQQLYESGDYMNVALGLILQDLLIILLTQWCLTKKLNW